MEIRWKEKKILWIVKMTTRQYCIHMCDDQIIFQEISVHTNIQHTSNIFWPLAYFILLADFFSSQSSSSVVVVCIELLSRVIYLLLPAKKKMLVFFFCLLSVIKRYIPYLVPCSFFTWLIISLLLFHLFVSYFNNNEPKYNAHTAYTYINIRGLICENNMVRDFITFIGSS